MSNRSLFEINHDFSHVIKGSEAAFLSALQCYLGSASPDHAEALRRFGVRVFGMRHHSDSFDIWWGAIKASEE